MSTQAKNFLTPEQYLEIDNQAEERSEYWHGAMFAMSGASRPHNLIVGNTAVQLHPQLRARSCEFYSNDMRVKVSETGLYTYPDLVIVCAVPQFLDGGNNTLLNPTVLIEVLSPSTEAYDRGRKFELYQAIPNLKQYLLIASERVRADLFTRRPDNEWLLKSTSIIEDTVELDSVGCRISLLDTYERVEFS